MYNLKCHSCGGGEIGRRAGLRSLWVTPYEFKSRPPHQKIGKRVYTRMPIFYAFAANCAVIHDFQSLNINYIEVYIEKQQKKY